LLHLVDAAGDDPVEAWRVVRGELDAYGADLADKPEIVALSRADLVDDKQLAKVRKALETATGDRVTPISAPTAQGIDALLDRIVDGLGSPREEEAAATADDRPWSPL
jgi:GTP-binding protein